MFEFINYLKLIATALITNSHFGRIWPVSALATGGLLGNVIFLAVSGFLLYNVKNGFLKWFSKRFFRVYPALAIFTLFAVFIGKYPMKDFEDAFRLFIYPTNYIFLVWLIICYCMFYIVACLDKKINNFLEIAMVAILVVWTLVYVVCYDKSAYTVDNVSEPFSLFLYIESMLLGSFFKKHQSDFNKFKISKIIMTVVCLAIYFVSKIIVSRVDAFLKLQILNQFVILITLFFIFDLFMSMEQFFGNIPKRLNCIVKHISNITLQIYVVQFVILRYCEKIPFPLNLITATVLILISATILYYLEVFIRKVLEIIVTKIKKG